MKIVVNQCGEPTVGGKVYKINQLQRICEVETVLKTNRVRSFLGTLICTNNIRVCLNDVWEER